MALADQIFGTGLGNVSFQNMSIINYIVLFIVGVVAAATMVIPGVSGSLVLMLLGYYLPIINVIKSLTKFENLFSNLLIAGVFGVGVLVGIVAISKLIEYLLNKFEIKTYFGVIGFIIASVFAIPISVMNEVGNIVFTIPQSIIGIILLILGTFIGYKLGEK